MTARRGRSLAAFALLSAVVTCKESSKPTPSATASVTLAPTPAPSMTVTATDASADVAPLDPLDEKLRHCPTTVDGAQTKITDVTGGVELIVTADTEEAVREIRRRARHMEDFTRSRADAGAHGNGAGGGWMRNCPVVTKGTIVSGTDVPGGSRIVVRPTDATAVVALRADVRRRWDALSAAVSGDR